VKQLARLRGWCTVAVAGAAPTDAERWRAEACADARAAGEPCRIHVLTTAGAKAVRARVAALVPPPGPGASQHPSRRALGYAFALSAARARNHDAVGAPAAPLAALLDFDESVELLTDASGAPRPPPLVDARAPHHRVGQAWHCAHERLALGPRHGARGTHGSAGLTVPIARPLPTALAPKPHGARDSLPGTLSPAARDAAAYWPLLPWNPHVALGALAPAATASSWPRGLPLDAVDATRTPCVPRGIVPGDPLAQVRGDDGFWRPNHAPTV
jgi:hypothetical protein